MLNTLKICNSWVTQRLANRFPLYAYLRQASQSVGQQLMNAAGVELQNRYWWENYNWNNTILNTADPIQIENLYQLGLPDSFDWNVSHNIDGQEFQPPSSITGVVDSVTYNISVAENNSLEDLWFGVPTRISLSEDTFIYTPPLGPTEIEDLPTVGLGTIQLPGKLWISISQNSKFTHIYSGQARRSRIILTGLDKYGREIEETIQFGFNGIAQTRHMWSILSYVKAEYIDANAFVRIDCFPISQEHYLDTVGLNTAIDGERPRFFGIGQGADGTCLEHKSFGPVSMLDVADGYDEIEAFYKADLYDSSAQGYAGLSLALWPKRNWIVVSTENTLHFHNPELQTPDYRNLIDAHSEAVVVIYIEKEQGVIGDEIRIRTKMLRPYYRVLRTRISVKKPDKSRVCINEAGTEIPFSDSGWVENLPGSQYNKVGLQEKNIPYTIAASGTYTFYLETIIHDEFAESGQGIFLQQDCRTFHCESNIALSSVPLPVGSVLGLTVTFDCYNRPWILGINGEAQRLNFHYDKCVIDYESRVIYFREPYESVQVAI